jgi:hypothetical protein
MQIIEQLELQESSLMGLTVSPVYQSIFGFNSVSKTEGLDWQ